jgi:hypothetical protein
VSPMRCEVVRMILEELRSGDAPDSVRGHLASCTQCAEWWQAWRMVSAGFRALSREAVPEPSWGFSERVVRRLQEAGEAGKSAADFLERAGRRVVWATLGVTLTVLLALVVPSSGPVRAASEPDYLLAQPQLASTQNYPIIEVENVDTAEPATTQPVSTGVEGEKK